MEKMIFINSQHIKNYLK